MEAIITLRKNTIMQDGICIYEDQYKNSVFMQKEADKDGRSSFVAKLRFNDKNIKAAPIKLSIPVENDTDGTMLHLDFMDGANREGDDIDCAIDMFTKIMQRWINLMYDLAPIHPALASEEAAKDRFEKLSQYEELSDVLSEIAKI